MILARDLSPPDEHELRACALWALAESTVVYPPIGVFLVAVRPFGLGAQVFAIPFVAAYVGGAVLGYRFRASRNLGTAAAVVAVLAGLLVGRDGIAEAAVAAVVALLVALRVVSLALRDWRSPIHAELGWGAAALGVEAILAAALPEWRPVFALFVPMFFGAALASRAVTVWTGNSRGELDERLGSPWVRRTLLAAAGLAAAMALAVVLGVRGGLFDLVGRVVRPVAEVVGSAVLWLILQAASPLFWLADRLGIDPERIREFLDRLRESVVSARGPVDARPPDPAPWARVLGLLVFLALGYAVYRVLRRVRGEAPAEDEPRPLRSPAPGARPVEERPPPARRRFRRELPADAVRRWYAEALLALRPHELQKAPALTPAEFVPEVAARFPDRAEDFRALTRAYEDMRYGGLRLGRDRLRALEIGHRRLLQALRAPVHRPVAPTQ